MLTFLNSRCQEKNVRVLSMKKTLPFKTIKKIALVDTRPDLYLILRFLCVPLEEALPLVLRVPHFENHCIRAFITRNGFDWRRSEKCTDIFAELEMVKVGGSNIIGLQKWVGPVPPTYNGSDANDNTNCDVTLQSGSLICMPPTFAYTRPCSRPAEPAQPHHQKFCRYCEETSEDNSKNGRSWK